MFPHCGQVAHLERYRQQIKSDKLHQETAYLITSLSPIKANALRLMQLARGHWGIENKSHYVRDVTMGEDKSRIRTNPHIFAKLRSFALNILRKNDVQNVSLELFENCLNLDNVLNYVGIL